jgi:hypothetical protein
MAGTGFHCFAKIRALFHRGVEFRTAECSKCFISFGGFFLNSNIFLGEKTQISDSDVAGPSPDPVLILYLDPGLNPDPVEYRSGCRIRVRINSVTNPDQFSYLMAVINPDPVKNPVTNTDQVTTPDPVTKLDPRTNPVMDPRLAPNPFTNLDSEQEPDRESDPNRKSEPDSVSDPDSEQDPDC